MTDHHDVKPVDSALLPAATPLSSESPSKKRIKRKHEIVKEVRRAIEASQIRQNMQDGGAPNPLISPNGHGPEPSGYEQTYKSIYKALPHPHTVRADNDYNGPPPHA